jgi:hypothetical protein
MTGLPNTDYWFDWYLQQDRERRQRTAPQARSLLEDGVPDIRASSLGSCMMAQHVQRTVEQPPREFDAKTLRTFRNGDIVGDELVRMYRRLGLLRFGTEISGGETKVHIPELGLTGHIDLILGWPPEPVEDIPEDRRESWSENWMEFLDHIRTEALLANPGIPDGWHTIVEVKTTHSTSMKYLHKEGEPRFGNAVQAGSYRLAAETHPEQFPEGFDFERSDTRVDYVGKDSFGMLSFDIGAKWSDEAMRRCQILQQAVIKGQSPECTCAGWEVEYCAFVQTPTTSDDDKKLIFTCCDGNGEYVRKVKSTDTDLLVSIGK